MAFAPLQHRVASRRMRELTVAEYRELESQALDVCNEKRPVQKTVRDFKVLRLSIKADQVAYFEYCKDFHNYLVETSGLVLDFEPVLVVPEGGDLTTKPISRGIPVTHTRMAHEKAAFFIVELYDPDNEDGPVVQFPIRMPDVYCSGVRVLKPGDDPVKKIWNSFSGEEELPQSLFINRRQSKHSISYEYIKSIRIYKGILEDIFKHFKTFPEDEMVPFKEISMEAAVLKDTLIFMCCESQRFWFAQLLTSKGLICEVSHPAVATSLMGDCIHNWSDTSSAVLTLWLAEIEMQLLREFESSGQFPGQTGHLEVNVANSKKKFQQLLLGTENSVSPDINREMRIGRHTDNDVQLARIPRALFIIKNDWPTALQVIMRKTRCFRPFPSILTNQKKKFLGEPVGGGSKKK